MPYIERVSLLSIVMEAESSPLLPVTDRTVARRRSYCKCTSFCIRSRPARWILLWNFAVLLSFKGLFSLEKVEQFNFITLASILANAVLVLFSIFSPVAGLLSDVKWSRYRAVLYSSRVIVILLLCLMMTALAMLTKYHFFLHTAATKYILTGIYGGVIPFSVIYITFIINTLQFGLDQLHDASTLDSVSYIHWYVWIYHTSSLVTSLFFNLLFYDAYYLLFYDADYINMDSLKITGACGIFATLSVSVTLLMILFIATGHGDVITHIRGFSPQS